MSFSDLSDAPLAGGFFLVSALAVWPNTVCQFNGCRYDVLGGGRALLNQIRRIFYSVTRHLDDLERLGDFGQNRRSILSIATPCVVFVLAKNNMPVLEVISEAVLGKLTGPVERSPAMWPGTPFSACLYIYKTLREITSSSLVAANNSGSKWNRLCAT